MIYCPPNQDPKDYIQQAFDLLSDLITKNPVSEYHCEARKKEVETELKKLRELIQELSKIINSLSWQIRGLWAIIGLTGTVAGYFLMSWIEHLINR